MSIITRPAANSEVEDMGTGFYRAKVISHLDPSFMGGLEVTLLKHDGNVVGQTSQTYPVFYAPPFYGNTAFEFMGENTNDFNDTQKSYGMWMVPPDVGVTVLVVFIDGRSDQGYWLACVPGRFTNHMVPGIAASTSIDFAPGDAETYDVANLPAAEINRRANDLGESLEIDSVPRPVHPFAKRLLEQGLLQDDVRGTTSSSSRRNAPSGVYGISTPGPVDRGFDAKRQFVGKSDSPTQTPVGVSRLGGNTFVMDDGDDRFLRAEPAYSGSPVYENVLEGGAGDPNIPKDECIRFRTRSGHQVLLHTSEDLIYIGNARGTGWIEISSDGKIDIFAEDSISVHTKQDFNFYADRDVNIEAGRNINMKASAAYADTSDTDANGNTSGRVYIESAHDTRIFVGGDTKLTTTGECHIASLKSNYITTVMDNHFKSIMDTYMQASLGMHMKSNTGMNVETSLGMHIKSGTSTNVESGTGFDLKSGADLKLTASGSGSLGAADLKFTGGSIDLNGPAAPDAEGATAATKATAATPTLTLGKQPNVNVNPLEAAWQGDRYISQVPIESIMYRIPMHEPWIGHENYDPLSVKPEMTNRELAGGGGDGAPAGGDEEGATGGPTDQEIADNNAALGDFPG